MGSTNRNLAMELVRVTEAAAMAAGRWLGRGDKNGADGAAVNAMRLMLGRIDMDGVVVIGEGEKDEAPMLFNGERIGTGEPPQVDVAVDPIDGTRLLAQARSNALAVVALSDRGTMFDPGPCVYMEKIAVGAAARDVIDIEAPLEDNLRRVAKAVGKPLSDTTVCVLDRDRHAEHIRVARSLGCRVKLIADGDVAGALQTADEDAVVDVLVGIGGSPEGVITACALKCLGGNLQAKLWPRDETERRAALDAGYEVDRILSLDDLVQGDNVFFAATGITSGELLRGVEYLAGGARTYSLLMRSRSGTVRRVEASHRWDKLDEITQVAYENR